MSIVVVAEKPSVARDLARVLGANARGEGVLTGNGYVVTWAIGHLVGLEEPDGIDERWRRWSFDLLPMFPRRWPLRVFDQTASQFGIVRRALTAPDVTEVICATDAGREGELIFRFIAEASGCRRPVKRLWISSLTDGAIRAGFSKLRPQADFDGLANAALGRSRADWLVGMNLSRAYGLSLDEKLSVGRVQTPTLALLVERELAIRNFVPEDYLEVVATFSPREKEQYTGVWHRDGAKEHPRRLPKSGEEAAAIVARAKSGVATVSDVTSKQKKLPPPQLYDLTELQRHANRLYGYSAQRTLELAQALYEQHKLISYPRTDSRHLSTEVAGTLRAVTDAIGPQFRPHLAPGTGSRPLGKRFVDDTEVSDHHAIIPTATSPDGRSLSVDERRVYELICRRLLQAWHDDFTWAATQVTTLITNPGFVDRFLSHGTAIEQLGWKVLDVGHVRPPTEKRAPGEEAEEEGLLPSGLKAGQVQQVLDAKAVPKRTRPPPRLTDATLLTAMETAGKTLYERELSEAMKENGLGTPATRANIIETLLSREYVVREGKALAVTEKGIRLIEVVDPEVKSAAMTGAWEAKLQRIAKGQGALPEFISGIERYVEAVIGRIRNNPPPVVRRDGPPGAPRNSSPRGAEPFRAGSPATTSSRGSGGGTSSPRSTANGGAEHFLGNASAASPSRRSTANGGTEHVLRPSPPASRSAPAGASSQGSTTNGGTEHFLGSPTRSTQTGASSQRSAANGGTEDVLGSPTASGRSSQAGASSQRSAANGGTEHLLGSSSASPQAGASSQPLAASGSTERLIGASSTASPDHVQAGLARATPEGGFGLRRQTNGITSRTSEDDSRPAPVPNADGSAASKRPPRGATSDPRALLAKFGHASFRPHQQEACDASIAGHDVLLVMPTGAGKSLCYQLPGLARGGTTLVVSPLIALMEDQVARLQSLGLAAERIHSGRPRTESRRVCADYLEGKLDYLFIAPERLGVAGFPELLARRTPSLIAIDEAHCISQWGHDFRPDYRLLGERLPSLRPAPVMALTATATPLVQRDIVKQLGLRPGARQLIHGFRRHNLAIEALEVLPKERPERALEWLLQKGRTPAIVYAATRKSAEATAEVLSGHLRVAPYHAGMSNQAREEAQTAFLHGDLDVIVATVAFGMGVDKADVRTVLHLALPGSVEGYYQEIGRAGRDGKPSRAVLMHHFVDRKTHEFFLERDYPDVPVLAKLARALSDTPHDAESVRRRTRISMDDFEKALEKLWIHGGVRGVTEDQLTKGHDGWQAPYEAQRRLRVEQLALMARFAESAQCRMVSLVKHFGDQTDTLERCGQCDVCNPSGCIAATFEPPTMGEVTVLSEVVARLRALPGQSIGRLCKEVLGEAPEARPQFERLVRGLARAGQLRLDDAVFEKDGQSIPYQRLYVIGEGDPKRALLAPKSQPAPERRGRAPQKRARRTKRAPRTPAVELPSTGESARLVETLRAWRLGEAKRRRVSAFRVLTNRALVAVAEARPTSQQALLKVKGLGPKVLQQSGAQLIALCSSH
ncbi:MAG: DNA topoisomerase III [Archangiaceae bacterium]|nr:DNA topoisomerase III [Archangiaceae bacterium]